MDPRSKKVLLVVGVIVALGAIPFIALVAFAARSVMGVMNASEVARVPFTAAGDGAQTFVVKANEELQLWTELDVEYSAAGGAALAAAYDVTAEQGGRTVATVHCDARDPSVRVMSLRTQVNDDVHERYAGKMRCAIAPPADGPVVLHATLAIPSPPPALRVRDLTLVVKR